MLEQTYDNKADIPAGYEHLYSEADGKFTLLTGTQIKTEEDTRKLQDSLRKERENHDTTKQSLKSFEALGDPEEALAKLDRIDELEEAAKGKIDDEKIDEMVAKRLQRERGPLDREITKLKTELETSTEKLTGLQLQDRQRRIADHVREHATPLRDTAVADALVLAERMFEVTEDGTITTRDGVGCTPGVTADVWLTEMRTSREHWFKDSQGAGSKGGDGGGAGKNPFTADNWNLTAQGAIVRENPAKAAQLAEMAGTTVGGGKPQSQSAA